MALKKVSELFEATEIQDTDVLLIDTGRDTLKMPYGVFCQKVKETLAIPTVQQSMNITEPGNIPDGPIITKAVQDIHKQLEASRGFNGKELTQSWADIDAQRRTGDFTGLDIGDYKDIVLTTGEQCRVEIGGIDTYLNTGDSPILTQHHLFFVFRDCLKTTYKMNTENTNAGGYAASELAKTLNTTIFNTLPADLRAVIKEVRRLDNNKGTWGWGSWKLFLLKETEVFGRNNWSDGYDGAGIQLPIFAHSYRHIIKGIGKGSSEAGQRASWWLASPSATNSTAFCLVSYGGNAGSSGASNSNGVAPGFII